MHTYIMFNIFTQQLRLILIGFLLPLIGIGAVPTPVFGQGISLPAPGARISLSVPFQPSLLEGIKIYPDNPFRFDFVLSPGDKGASAPGLKEESEKLIKYFLASLTILEKDLWVNLSPYEKDRIVPESFGQTEMGRDLLAQDYMLKQVTASLIYPEDESGRKFWKRIYEESAKKFGTTNIPVNTFNKVWIVPQKAVVYENAKTASAYVVESKLKVMLEEDYLATTKNQATNLSTSQKILKEIVIPQLTKEVNQGQNFAPLRQVYHSLILAAWYKKKVKDSILKRIYIDHNKVGGINIDGARERERIYQSYLQAFKKGAYHYIKEEHDPITQKTIPRKYFSGGAQLYISQTIDIKPMPAGSRFLGRFARLGKALSPLLIAVTLATAALPAKLAESAEPGAVQINASSPMGSFLEKDLVDFMSQKLMNSPRDQEGFLRKAGLIHGRLREFLSAILKENTEGNAIRLTMEFNETFLIKNGFFLYPMHITYQNLVVPFRVRDIQKKGASSILTLRELVRSSYGPTGYGFRTGNIIGINESRSQEAAEDVVRVLKGGRFSYAKSTGASELDPSAQRIITQTFQLNEPWILQQLNRITRVHEEQHRETHKIHPSIRNPPGEGETLDETLSGIAELQLPTAYFSLLILAELNSGRLYKPGERILNSLAEELGLQHRVRRDDPRSASRLLGELVAKYPPETKAVQSIAPALFNKEKNQHGLTAVPLVGPGDRASLSQSSEVSRATQNLGGIDLNNKLMDLHIKNQGQGMSLEIDSAMLAQLQNAPGFRPVIIGMEYIDNLPLFFGIKE